MSPKTARSRLPFFKMHGSGNDFVLIDHRQPVIPEAEQPEFVRRVCVRQTGVGADGLIFLEHSDTADFRWRFYNADGSVAEMCGNGARCAARCAVLTGIAPGPQVAFETLAGLIRTEVRDRRVRVALADVGGMRLSLAIPLEGDTLTGHFIRVGVPHVVVPVADLEETPVTRWGRQVRFHELFAPAGTNVNFVRALGPHELAIRTYERGVEDETLACGTGAVASALISSFLGKVSSPVTVHTRGGERLTISFHLQGNEIQEVFLEGEARVAYQGELWLDELK